MLMMPFKGGYHPVKIGEVFDSDASGLQYTVLAKLGWGHFSTVWMCRVVPGGGGGGNSAGGGSSASSSSKPSSRKPPSGPSFAAFPLQPDGQQPLKPAADVYRALKIQKSSKQYVIVSLFSLFALN